MKISLSLKRTSLLLILVTIFAFCGYAQSGNAAVATSGQNQVLPVTLTSFSLKSDEPDKIIARWQTASERNNSHFNIQVSVDGFNYVNYAKVDGKGDSNEITDYQVVIDLKSKILTGSLFLSFLLISSVSNRKLRMAIATLFLISLLSCSKDKITEQKTYYVQLVQVDNDGKTTMSSIAALNADVTK